MLTPEAQQIANAWLEAGQELRIEVISPFSIHTASGEVIEYIALVPQFGSANGMLLINDFDQDRIQAAQANGYGYSCLYLSSYGDYQREHFIDALNDWGWSEGQGNPPDWYTGEPWSD